MSTTETPREPARYACAKCYTRFDATSVNEYDLYACPKCGLTDNEEILDRGESLWRATDALDTLRVRVVGQPALLPLLEEIGETLTEEFNRMREQAKMLANTQTYNPTVHHDVVYWDVAEGREVDVFGEPR